MAGPLTPYMMQLLMRGIPIAQQRLGSLAQRALPASSGAAQGAAMAPGAGAYYGNFTINNPYRPMANALAPAAAIMAARAATGGGSPPQMSEMANKYGVGAPRTMTVRGANQWAGVNPEAGMDQMYAKEIAAANAAFNDPEAGMDQMYAAEIAQSLKKPATKKVAAPKMTKAQQKVFADAAKEYQSNSMPVLMQPQGPTKGGAAMRPQINWGTNQQGYDTMGNFGGNAADLLRADAMRKQMMEAGMGGLLG